MKKLSKWDRNKGIAILVALATAVIIPVIWGLTWIAEVCCFK